MATHNDTGKLGETLAQEYLVSQGFAIMATNWHRGKFEIDIIAYREGLIVFAEVKTRSHTDHGNPEEFVDNKKQRAYVRLADGLMLAGKSKQNAPERTTLCCKNVLLSII